MPTTTIEPTGLAVSPRIFQPMPRPYDSPWGRPDEAIEIAHGIWNVFTPSHGGILITHERFRAMPAVLQEVRPYGMHELYRNAVVVGYEEDCDWCIPVLAFPEEFRVSAFGGGGAAPDVVTTALRCYRQWMVRTARGMPFTPEGC